MPAVEHVRLDAGSLSTGETYRLMTDLVAPRPIAWVSTVDSQGHENLAPFSYFQAVSSRPPTIMLSISSRPGGRPKDTLRNILDTRELVVSHVAEALLEAMNRTSGEYDEDVDEWTLALGEPGAVPRLASTPSTHVRPPRVAAAVAAMEARLQHAIPLGEAPHGGPSSTLVLARVLCFHVAAPLVDRDARGRLRLPLDPARLSAVGRLGGIAYARTRERVELPRPKGTS